VIPERSWDQKPDDIRQYDVDILLMGDDWKGRFDSLVSLCEVVYLPRTQHISSTQLKKSLTQFLSVSKEEVLKAFEIIDILRQDFE
jgi:glycerol-3-phosphate cytidylyltransferase